MMDLRSHGTIKDLQRFERPAQGPELRAAGSGFNYRMTDPQAARLESSQRLEAIVAEGSLS